MAAISPTAPDKKSRFWLRYPDIRLASLYILPAFLVMAFITFYPIAYQFWLSITNFELKHLRLMNPDFIGLENYLP